MLTFVILTGLLGAVLGLRFKVLILIPVLLALPIIVMAGKAVFSLTISFLAVTAAAACALQIGYLGGLYLRSIMAAARVPAIRRKPRTAGLETEY